MTSSAAGILGATIVTLGCATNPPKPAAPPQAAGPANPLLEPWTGPWGGVPPFGRFKVADLKPALDAAMAENLAEDDRIAKDPAAPTFDNTIAALERAGHALDRVTAVYEIYTSTMNDDEVQAIEREMAPKLAAFNDQIVQNKKLFERIAAVYEKRDGFDLNAEQKALLRKVGGLTGKPEKVPKSFFDKLRDVISLD